MNVPYRVHQMAALFVAAQKPRTYTTDYHYASSESLQWFIIDGVVYARQKNVQRLIVPEQQRKIDPVYTCFVGLCDYDPNLIWSGKQWERARELMPLEIIPVDYPTGMDCRYRWFVC